MASSSSSTVDTTKFPDLGDIPQSQPPVDYFIDDEALESDEPDSPSTASEAGSGYREVNSQRAFVIGDEEKERKEIEKSEKMDVDIVEADDEDDDDEVQILHPPKKRKSKALRDEQQGGGKNSSSDSEKEEKSVYFKKSPPAKQLKLGKKKETKPQQKNQPAEQFIQQQQMKHMTPGQHMHMMNFLQQQQQQLMQMQMAQTDGVRRQLFIPPTNMPLSSSQGEPQSAPVLMGKDGSYLTNIQSLNTPKSAFLHAPATAPGTYSGSTIVVETPSMGGPCTPEEDKKNAFQLARRLSRQRSLAIEDGAGPESTPPPMLDDHENLHRLGIDRPAHELTPSYIMTHG